MLLPTSYRSRWPARLGLLAMLVLLALSWHFYRERTAFSDLAFHIFVNIDNRAIFIQFNRVAQIPTQLLPLWAIKAGWPLAALLRLFSVSFLLYYLLLYVLGAYALRNVRAALLMPLSLLLVAGHTFYWPQAETAQSMAALVLVHAALSRRAPLPLSLGTLGSALLLVAGIFGHPLAVFVFGFLWVYEWLLNSRWRDWPYYGLLAIGLLAYGVRNATVPAGSYEDVGSAFMRHLHEYFPAYWSLPSFSYFMQLCRGEYLAIPLILVAYTACCLRYRQGTALLRLLLVWAAVAGYALIVSVWLPTGNEPTYMENLYLPLGFFVGAPLVFELLPQLERFGRRGPALAAGVLGAVLAIRLVVVYELHRPYTAYQQWLGHLLAYTRPFPERRYVLDQLNADPAHLHSRFSWWATPYETLLLTALPASDSARSLFVTNEAHQVTEAGRQPGMFIGPFNQLPSWNLDGRFFRIGADQQSYRALNTAPPPADEPALRAYVDARRGTQLTIVEQPAHLAAGQSAVLRIRLAVPPGGQPLHSAQQGRYPTLVRSIFTDTNGWPSATPPQEVPLEMDVWHPWEQAIPLNCPTRPGHYLLQVQLFSKGGADWPVRTRVPVTVE